MSTYLPLTHSIQLIRKLSDRDLEDYNRISNFGINIENDTLGIAMYYVYSLYGQFEEIRRHGHAVRLH